MSDAIAPLHDRPIAEGRWVRLQERSFMRSNKLHRYEIAVRRGCKGIVACLPVTHQAEIVFDEKIETYLALDCTADLDGSSSGEASEQIECHRIARADAWDWLLHRADSGMVDPKAFAVLAWYLHLCKTS
jgi:hypothetical protein